MGNCVSTAHHFCRFARRRRVRKDPPMNRDDPIEEGEIRDITEISLKSQCEKSEVIGEKTSRMEQVNTCGNPEEEEEKKKEKKKKVEAEIEGREDEDGDEDSECSSSLREFLMLERLCEEYEELEQIKSRIEQENASEKAVQKAVQKKVEEEIESRVDESENSECSSSLTRFLMMTLERLCEKDVGVEKKNRMEEKNRSVEAEERKVENEEIASGEDDDSECSSSLREFLMLERLCEEYEETKQRRRERREQEKLETRFKKFREDQLSTIEEEDDEQEEEEDSSVKEVGEECEHPDTFHREEGKDAAASGDADHIQGEKLMSFEEFCGETFAVSPTFLEDLMEESRISQRRLEQAHEEFGKSLRLILLIMNEMVGKLEKGCKGNEVGDTISKQKRLRLIGPLKAK
nr:expressed protein [Hymenolepis microstoma]